MPHFQIKTPSEQLAEFLKEQILDGRYQELMPGMAALAKELGTDPKTVGLALGMLEKDGLLVPQGAGKPRRIAPAKNRQAQKLKLIIQSYGHEDQVFPYLLSLRHRLMEQGHQVDLAKQSLLDLKMDPRRVARQFARNPGDAWLVIGASSEVLEWFTRQQTPCFALLGRSGAFDVAATAVNTPEAYREVVRRLVELGHQRIVFMTPEERREPSPAEPERAFLDELQTHGIQTGDYNLPSWEDKPASITRCLDSLFAHTPPTAIVCSVPEIYVAVQMHLAKKGIHAPDDISLISTYDIPLFTLTTATPACLAWDESQLERRIMRWFNNIARGKDDRRKSCVKAKFLENGTVGHAPG